MISFSKACQFKALIHGFFPVGLTLVVVTNLISSASAQTQSVVPVLAGQTAPQMGVTNLVNPNSATPPTLTRLDFGATDAQRANLTHSKEKKIQTPSQFQKFVSEGTGLVLNHFGASLFENPDVYSAESASPAPGEYVLGSGDELRIQIWGSVEYVGSQTLDRSGQINLPKVGAINLSGVQVKDLEGVLRKHIGTVFNNFSLSATLGKLRGITVYVVGQANQPGTYTLNSLSTLVNALFASGGPNVNGSMRQIELKRGGKTITSLDLYDFISKGDKSKDAALQSGDVIMIPPAGPRMALVGATDHAGIYEIKVGSQLKDVLAIGGGISSLASQQKALLERINPQDPQAPRQVQNIALNMQGLDYRLQDGDLVTLLSISPAFANAVTLLGNVAQSVRHPWVADMRISDLIPEPSALISADYYLRKNKTITSIDSRNVGKDISSRINNMTDSINWDYAIIERLDSKKIENQIIPFNLAKAILKKDPSHNLILQPGDVITIFSSNDLRLPTNRKLAMVRIEGEVESPGIYQLLPGETLTQLIKRVGGFTDQAYIYGAEFSRESVRSQQQSNLDQLIRRLESQSVSTSANLAANWSASRITSANTVIDQQQLQTQNQIARLKSFKSKGRMSLELDPQNPQLPDLILEDGDNIFIPTTPGFVSAAGSVNNENVFVYRADKTAGDILENAGLTEDADPNEIFILRADGSVLSKRQTTWTTRFESVKLKPGDTIIVPNKVDRESGYNMLMRGLRDWTQVFSNLGIGAAAIKTLKN